MISSLQCERRRLYTADACGCRASIAPLAHEKTSLTSDFDPDESEASV